ncbi:MAG: hypothetical protein V1706_15720 [Pseudomonadota bacterium]
MNVIEYCQTVVGELENWRRRLALLDHKIAAQGSKAQGKTLDDFEELHLIIAALDARVHALRNECPVSRRKLIRKETVGPVTINWDAAIKAKTDSGCGG